jgi:5-methylcytosine-specific restriction endonuclease McrA
MGRTLSYVFGSRTVDDLLNMQEKDRLNLEPGFQRKSVWNKRDRQHLIESILDNYPVPSIFLYKREENGLPVYDVLDGKQRLETIFMFTRAAGYRRRHFDERLRESVVSYRFEDDEQPYLYRWADLQWWALGGRLLNYSIQTVEVSGDLADIIDLFVRINSTGKALTSSEKRNARFFKGPFLKEANRLARRYRSYLINQRIVSESQIDRMKDVELVSELLISIAAGGPVHSKKAVDKAVGAEAIHGKTLQKTCRDFRRVMDTIRKMFPQLRSTRFRNTSEFYSLALVVHELIQQGMVLNDKRRNREAMAILQSFSDGVDEVRELQRRAKAAGSDRQLYTSYLLSVQRGTDAIGQRNRRADILRGLLAGLFERKDAQRIFSPEQRRLLWSSDSAKNCSLCGSELTWGNFHVDHWKPHSRGGKTSLRNAKLLCISCNLSKKDRRVPDA